MIFIKLASILALLSTPSHATSVKVNAEHEDKGAPKLLRGGLYDIAIASDVEQGVDDKLHESDDYGNEDITIWNGDWGSWKPWRSSQVGGLYACGAQMRSEDNQGGGSDDTAANGLKLKYCGLRDWRNQKEQTIWDGSWGGWKTWGMCPYGKYIGGARVRFEDNVGDGDDTALNGLEISCVDKDGGNHEATMVYQGMWGAWKPWKYTGNKLVKGAKVRYEDNVGNGDDTAMNGIQFNVEIPNFGISHSGITGEWALVASGPQGQISHKIIESTQTTSGEELTEEEAYGFEETISAGFSIKGVVDVSASVTASQSMRTAAVMSSSLTVYSATETTLGCPDSGSDSGYYFMWQFKMAQPADYYGNGFQSSTKNIRCTPSYEEAPRCALGSCDDAFCQQCKA